MSKLKIKSITDVITNSSNECFSMKIGSYFWNRIVELVGIDEVKKSFGVFNTLDDVREYIKEHEYIDTFVSNYLRMSDIPRFPRYDIFDWENETEYERLKKIYTEDEIWEMVKENYVCLLGYALCHERDENEFSPAMQAAHDLNGIISEELLSEIANRFPIGTFVTAEKDFRDDSLPHRRYVFLRANTGVANVHFSCGVRLKKDEKPRIKHRWETYSPEHFEKPYLYEDGGGFFWLQGEVDYTTFRIATLEESAQLMEEMTKHGYKKDEQGNIYKIED